MSVPLLTPELPGTSGLTRVAAEDFFVEELPLYEPSGEGEHLYLTVEKVGRTTQEVAREIAQALGVREREVGTAGQKDKRAVTVQRMSVHSRAPAEEALKISGPGFRVLQAARHGNKLRTGHLRGNSFRIVVRGCVPAALARAQAVCARLRQLGAANLFGPQRFGKYGDNAELGRKILSREAQVRDRFLRRMALSALQSELFNRCLSARIADGIFSTAVAGDVLRKLAEAGIDPRSFAAGGDDMQGARRPYRVPVEDLFVEEAGEGALRLSFSLPKGSYALAVLREVLKSDDNQGSELGSAGGEDSPPA